MSIKFSCAKCKDRLKAHTEQAGKLCRCPRCGQAMVVPAPAAPAAGGKNKVRRVIGAFLAVALVAGGVFLAVLLYGHTHQVDLKLADLAGDVADTRVQALLWLAEAEPQDAHRAQVTAALEPLIAEGDARRNLDPDLLLQAYLHWASADNVPYMIHIVDNAHLPSWNERKTELVMQTLGKLHDTRAADVLAEKLSDPRLRGQAADALKQLGRGAEGAVVEGVFADDPAVRERAADLLAAYGTTPDKLTIAAWRRLDSNDTQGQRLAAAWFADNPPEKAADKRPVAARLTALLGDLSPQTNGLSLRALKLWATPDCLPQLVEFARRLDGAAASKEVAANKSTLIDVLAQFADKTAAEAIALQLKDPGQRDKAAQGLAKLGPVAGDAVLLYLNHPNEGVRKEAASLCRALKIPADHQLAQTLADVADVRKARSRAALQRLAALRPDDAARTRVSEALNAALLDTDAGIRDGALDAVRVWGTRENTATLLKLLGGLHGEWKPRDGSIVDRVAEALVSIGPGVEGSVIPLLKSSDAVVRRAVCEVLAEVGTGESVQPLQDAGAAYASLDPSFYQQTHVAASRVAARK
jgi:hypothetical protein